MHRIQRLARMAYGRGVLVVLLLGVFSGAVVADVHPVKMTAGIIVLAHDTTVNISLLSEEVTIDIRPTFQHVRVIFLLQCHDSAYDSLWIGFPGDHQRNKPRGFSARVDGEVVTPYTKIWRKPNALLRAPDIFEVSGKKYQMQNGNIIQVEEYDETSYVVFQTSFRSGQQRHIEIEYYQRLHYWPDFWPREDTLQFYGGYIFRTGVSWKGPINHAVLNLNIMGMDSERLQMTFPFKPIQTKLGYRFEMSDWEPTHDLEYRFVLLRNEIISMEADPAYSVSSLPAYLQTEDRFIRISRFMYFAAIDSMTTRETDRELLLDSTFIITSLLMGGSVLHLYDSLQNQMARSGWEAAADDLIGLTRQDTSVRAKMFAEDALKNIRNALLYWYRFDVHPSGYYEGIMYDGIRERPRRVVSPEVWMSAMDWFSAGQQTEEDSLLQLAVDDSSYATTLSYTVDDFTMWSRISRAFLNVAVDRMNRIKIERAETAKQIRMTVIAAGIMFVLTITVLTLKWRRRKLRLDNDTK